MPLICSYFSERSFQQEPVVQHAGFPSEVDSGESENAPDCQEQSGLPASAGVSCLYSFACGLCLPDAQNCCWITRRCTSCKCNSSGVCPSFAPPPSLVVQLARDLQTDFYPHFPDFFILITSLLDTKDTELLEWAFTCLSYLYKYLWRLMVKDMSNIYRWEIRWESDSVEASQVNLFSMW